MWLTLIDEWSEENNKITFEGKLYGPFETKDKAIDWLGIIEEKVVRIFEVQTPENWKWPPEEGGLPMPRALVENISEQYPILLVRHAMKAVLNNDIEQFRLYDKKSKEINDVIEKIMK